MMLLEQPVFYHYHLSFRHLEIQFLKLDCTGRKPDMLDVTNFLHQHEMVHSNKLYIWNAFNVFVVTLKHKQQQRIAFVTNPRSLISKIQDLFSLFWDSELIPMICLFFRSVNSMRFIIFYNLWSEPGDNRLRRSGWRSSDRNPVPWRHARTNEMNLLRRTRQPWRHLRKF